MTGLLGQPFSGSGSLAATVTGTESRPSLELHLSGVGIRLGPSGTQSFEANLSATSIGLLDNPETRVEIAAKGRVEGIVTPEGVTVPPELGRDIDWSFAATAARDGSTIDLAHLSAEGLGLAVSGSGRLTLGGAIDGRLHLAAADLRPFSGLAGHPLTGSIELDANAVQESATGFRASIDGSAEGLLRESRSPMCCSAARRPSPGRCSGIPPAPLSWTGWRLPALAVKLSGDGRFDPGSDRLSAALGSICRS